MYYKRHPRRADVATENAVIEEFRANWSVYGMRKLKWALKRKNTPLIVSRRKIGKIMKKYSLVSKYVKRRGNPRKSRVNEDSKPNMVNREFNNREILEVVVSDLTYVKVGGAWHYVCLLLDLAAREIIGHAAGRNKDAKLVRKAFYRVKADIRNIHIFHTDRGSEFKNELIDGIISGCQLFQPRVPLDNFQTFQKTLT
jgi:transposase InsO family protein